MADQSADAAIFARWKAELDHAQKEKSYQDWLQRAEKIVKRYRDERTAATKNARRMNILWSNVQTLLPAVYAKAPKPIVERRFMDRDPAARLASTILERCLTINIENGYFHENVGRAVLDHLLPGMGQTWIRYEPQFEDTGEKNAKVERSADDIQEEGDGTPYEKLAYERVCVDYVFYRDFLWGSCRFWCEVPWVSRRCWLTHSEIAEKFYDGDMEKAKKITLDYTPDRLKNADDQTISYFKKAEIWEIWNKADHTVYFIAPGTPDYGVLKIEKMPVLKLEGFWPCSEPLFATQSNETVVPVPDYVEYQDQAQELDDLTARIAALTSALRVNGVYDASVPALALLLQDGTDNKLVPVDQWAMFAEKGGIPGAISLVPIKEIGETLIGLYSARQQVKGDLYEVTGMSDIVRGAGEPDETATAQRIKGQFASMRLEDRRGKVNTFVKSNICIMAEVISEMFSPETLLQMSGVDLMIADDVRKAVEQVPPPPEPELPPEVPPEQQQMLMQQMKAQQQQAHEQAKAQVAAQVQQAKMQEFQKAVDILKSDKLRGFRVDIETDSTIVSDAAADKEAATQLVASTTEGLTALGPIVQQAPELMKPMGDLLMFAFRRFRVGRTVEASLEDALDQINQKIEQSKGQPPPPSPEEVKAQAEQQKMQAQMQIDQQKAQIEVASKSADMEMERERNDMERQRMADEMTMAREKHAMEMQSLAVQRQQADEDRANDNEDRQFKRSAEQEKMGFAREQHSQVMQAKKTENDGKRAEAGLPSEDSLSSMTGEMAASRESMMQVMLAQAEALKELPAAIDNLAKAMMEDKEVVSSDGRSFRSRRVVNGG